MIVSITDWFDLITHKIKTCFGDRVLFIGFQGSYKRNEADNNSDIDLVVILDELNFDDLVQYRKIIRSMPDYKKACGFISGKKEICAWSKSDLFQFAFETEALFGDINDIISKPDVNDIKIYVKTATEALYHQLCHNFLYEDNIAANLSDFYKMTFFILQAEYYIKNNIYISTKKELLNLLEDKDKLILYNCIHRNKFKTKNAMEISGLYKLILEWCNRRLIFN